MPKVTVLLKHDNGQVSVLSRQDRIVEELVTPCDSPRCSSRHKSDSPTTVTVYSDGSGEEFFEIGFSPKSPSHTGASKFFCSPTCAKDWFTYEYISPGPSNPEPVQPITPEAATTLPVNVSTPDYIRRHEPAIPQPDGDSGDEHAPV